MQHLKHILLLLDTGSLFQSSATNEDRSLYNLKNFFLTAISKGCKLYEIK